MSNFIAFIVLFGVLVFFHELGHFLAAKYFKIGVERFALGFGPKIFGKRIGETEYIIASIPLGGYVKMVGDEPTDERQAAQTATPLPENGFLAKPAWQRIIVVLMGPIANFILPIALFFVLYLVGQPNVGTEVGYVSHNSVAQAQGILPGDRILTIESTPVTQWTEVNKLISLRAEQPTHIEIERRFNQQVTTQKITLTPKKEDDVNVYGEPVMVGRIGISPTSFRLLVEVPDGNSLAYKKGLRSGAELTDINGVPVRFIWQIEQVIAQTTSNIMSLSFKSNAAAQVQHIEFPRSQIVSRSGALNLTDVGIYWRELMIDQVLPKSIAAEKGMQPKDILLAVNHQPIQSWFAFQEFIRASEGTLQLSIVRQDKTMVLEMSPRQHEQREELTGEKIRQRLLGVTSFGEPSMANLYTERVLNPVRALGLSVARCYELVEMTVVSFVKLIAGKVSAKSLGGPILIYQLAGKSWQNGLHAFINMIVLISISLGVLNLLPVPVLDGGHLMFYLIEIIKGSPVRARTRELAQQVGIAFIIGLMLFAFYNDLSRIAWSELRWLHWLRQLFS